MVVERRVFDVPVVAEAETVYRGIAASTPEEAEQIARRLWEEGKHPPEGGEVRVAEVGPAVEVTQAGRGFNA